MKHFVGRIFALVGSLIGIVLFVLSICGFTYASIRYPTIFTEAFSGYNWIANIIALALYVSGLVSLIILCIWLLVRNIKSLNLKSCFAFNIFVGSLLVVSYIYTLTMPGVVVPIRNFYNSVEITKFVTVVLIFVGTFLNIKINNK